MDPPSLSVASPVECGIIHCVRSPVTQSMHWSLFVELVRTPYFFASKFFSQKQRGKCERKIGGHFSWPLFGKKKWNKGSKMSINSILINDKNTLIHNFSFVLEPDTWNVLFHSWVWFLYLLVVVVKVHFPAKNYSKIKKKSFCVNSLKNKTFDSTLRDQTPQIFHHYFFKNPFRIQLCYILDLHIYSGIIDEANFTHQVYFFWGGGSKIERNSILKGFLSPKTT